MADGAKQEMGRSLVRKLSEVMDEVDRVPKSGRNSFHGYDYATEADIAAAVRGGMAKRRLMLVPSVEKTEWAKLKTKNGEQDLCTLTVRFTMMDGDSGENLSYVVLGQGSDTGDKATYKAMTGAEKYALMKIFLIPTGDDPERDEVSAPAAQEIAVVAHAQMATNAPTKTAEGNPIAGAVVDLDREPGQDSPEPPFARPQPITFRFGKRKGATSHAVTDSDLTYYVMMAKKSVDDPTKKRFLEANKRELEQLMGEAKWRAAQAA